ncbi:hypothetical protein [Anaerosporobacter faecicola]|uniref:hypothetical protein n=1 Tax=Anaerosporobacter faecicola TaxID=2718714 RepID=UPI00143A97FC|nr:hypothetical protein [Anaerosporobacter faecicola]
MKKFKLLTYLFIASLIIMPSNLVKAAESIPTNEDISNTEDDTLDLRLDKIVVHTDYNTDEVNVVRQATIDGVTTVEIVDKNTNALIETLTEYVEGSTQNQLLRASGVNSNIVVKRDQYKGPFVLSFVMHLNVYQSGSFRQINSVLSKNYYITSSSSFTLENVDASVYASSFPTTEVKYSGSGVLTGEVYFEAGHSTSNEGGFTIGELISAGFTVSEESSSVFGINYYVRGFVSISGTYSVY